jgi:hypothetical protein
VERSTILLISLAVTAALCSATFLALFLTRTVWRSTISAVARLFRGEDDHPHFELLMQ